VWGRARGLGNTKEMDGMQHSASAGGKAWDRWMPHGREIVGPNDRRHI